MVHTFQDLILLLSLIGPCTVVALLLNEFAVVLSFIECHSDLHHIHFHLAFSH